MADVKLTKNELKRQNDMLKRFKRYLPTLQLKKQQLQMVIRQVEQRKREVARRREELSRNLEPWIAVFAEDLHIERLLTVESLVTETGNIAGIDIPVFKELKFGVADYDLYAYPLWVDTGIERLKDLLSADAEIRVLDRQLEIIGEELRITSQRVNLFEKIKIPETQENIRRIRIYLGDQQTAAVVRGKISKNKITRGESS
ncbi:MAG: V-type ATP synthase subunit D [Spirochaetales bacterium]